MSSSLGSGANLPWCGALCVHRSGVPNHLQESLTSRKHLGQAKAKTTGGLDTALAKLRKTRHVSPGYSHLSTTGKASTAPACLPRLTRVACLSISASSHCGTWYFGIDTRTRLPKLSLTCLMCRENASSGARQWGTKWSNVTKGS